VNSVAARGGEMFAHVYTEASFDAVSPAGLGAGIADGQSFAFTFDDAAFYSIELTTAAVRMTPRDGSEGCTVPLDPSLRDLIAIDADAVYVVVDTPGTDPMTTVTARLLRIPK
jgi:hypothetical protein